MELFQQRAQSWGALVDEPLGPSVVMPVRVLANAEAVARYAGTLDPPHKRKSFLRALERVQPLTPNLSPECERIALVFEPRDAREEEALCRIMAVEELPTNWRYADAARDEIVRRIEKAWEVLDRTSGLVHSSIRTIIGNLLMAQLPGYEGGSVSSVIGAIWVGLDSARPIVDFAELLLHEYVHNCLFLEDMVRGVFVDGEDRLGETDALVTSAILRVPRGYDKSYHSAFVAVVLAEMNRRLGRHDRHRTLLAPVPTTLHGLLERQQFLTPAGQSLLAELNAWVDANGLGSVNGGAPTGRSNAGR